MTRSQVTFNAEWSVGRNRREFVRDVTLALTGQGGLTNKILATVLGFTKVLDATGERDSTNNVINASPSFDGTFIVLSILGVGTPADSSATIRMLVHGNVD